MELNDYQAKVITDLREYLWHWGNQGDAALAFRNYGESRGWVKQRPAYHPAQFKAPAVCIKVPTAGGKTFIAINALKEIFDGLGRRRGDYRLVVWLVPSLSILDQVDAAFNDPSHAYRAKLMELFSRVAVLRKDDCLTATGFTADEVAESVTIAVLSYDSLRARNKDDRKIFQENGQLQSFTDALTLGQQTRVEGAEPSALINIFHALNPVVIVDESHNAKSELSLEMLANLNPAFVLELTATPRSSSNIISFTDAMALKLRHMVKLPVIVRKLDDRDKVIAHAIDLRNRLEAEAEAEQESGGVFIRPMVLVQAEPKNKDDSHTFERIHADLLERGIPAAQIKLKTASKDELKGINLSAPDCDVRYIITVNALKEGWDCPFAYILATVAERSSVVDVEQILGRILRQPCVREHGREALNMSYVLTSSAQFGLTLNKIVDGLNRAGFSRHDCRTPDWEEPKETAELPTTKKPLSGETLQVFDVLAEKEVVEYAPPNESEQPIAPIVYAPTDNAELTLKYAHAVNEETQATIKAYTPNQPTQEEQELMHTFTVKPCFAEEIAALHLPQFFQRTPEGFMFNDTDEGVLLAKDVLLKDFRLVDCAVNELVFPVAGDLNKIDLRNVGTDDKPDYEAFRVTLKVEEIRRYRDFFANLEPLAHRQQLAGLVASWVGKMPPLSDSDLRAYIGKVIARLSPAQLQDCLERQQEYLTVIRVAVRQEMLKWARRRFAEWVDVGKITVQGYYQFPKNISPAVTAPAIDNSLYIRESAGNGLENQFIDDLANMENVLWWHRNMSKGKTVGDGDFYLNGAINHYPDFIIKTRKGRIVLVENKGDDRDNTDSAAKIELGRRWEAKAGDVYRYMMVFDQNRLDGAYNREKALEILRQL
ncbi:MAG: DEAD/DEAH box helicase family protein [Proteobacteria bacterium]|nr:DEAD/DEAH box helicase family protein [Pseudomonadota bacterium]